HSTAPTDTYPLSLHDALPISSACPSSTPASQRQVTNGPRKPTTPNHSAASNPKSSSSISPTKTSRHGTAPATIATLPSPSNRATDRKSTRLNSSHVAISYAVF